MTEQEPSMEDILSSIRNILYDDKAAEQAKEAAEAARIAQAEAAARAEAEAKAAEARAAKEAEAAVAAVQEPPETEEKVVELTDDMMVEKPSDEGLVSETAVDAAAGALSELTEKIQEKETPVIGNPLPLGNAGETLESMAKEVMKPLLKAWLDENLPTLVERIVKKEIQRVTEKAEG